MEYNISKNKLSYHNGKGRVKCAHVNCHEYLRIGDRIVRHYGSTETRLFHKRCAQELNII